MAEMVMDLSTADFLVALKIFVARLSYPEILATDDGWMSSSH